MTLTTAERRIRHATLSLEAKLRQLYSLTPAEIRLALSLLDGRSLRSAAKCLGIQYETARTSLKTIFKKTDTRRQAQLILLLLQLIG